MGSAISVLGHGDDELLRSLDPALLERLGSPVIFLVPPEADGTEFRTHEGRRRERRRPRAKVLRRRTGPAARQR